MNAITKAYFDIFRLVPETCFITEVKLISEIKGEGDDIDTYEFLCKIEVPTGLGDIEPSSATCTKLRSWASRRLKDYGGSDIIKMVSFEVKTKDGKKTKRFSYATHLMPRNIFDFKISGGKYIITAKCYGAFYG